MSQQHCQMNHRLVLGHRAFAIAEDSEGLVGKPVVDTSDVQTSK